MVLKLRYLLVLIFLITASKFSLAEDVDKTWHQLEIGFNLDYPDRVTLFEPALAEVSQLGIEHVYIYEIFDGKPDDGYQLRLKKALDSILKYGMTPMICISNAHARLKPKENQIKQFTKNLPSTINGQLERISTYTNRYPPDNWQDYKNSIQELINFLFSTYGSNVVKEWSFEVGNEPDAPRYYWGNSEQFIKMYQSATEVLLDNGINKIGGPGITHHSVLLNKKKNLNNLKYHNFVRNIYCDSSSHKFISFHLFNQNELQPLENFPIWLSNSSCSIMITGWNVSSRSKEAERIFNEPGAWGKAFIHLLVDSAQFGIDRLYIFNLMDYPILEKPQLGAFDRNGGKKKWYEDFRALWNVIRDGYRVTKNENKIIIDGKRGQSIILSLTSHLSINPHFIIYTPFDNLNLKKIKFGNWVIISTSPTSNNL